jgi:hypothetical protein
MYTLQSGNDKSFKVGKGKIGGLERRKKESLLVLHLLAAKKMTNKAMLQELWPSRPTQSRYYSTTLQK